MGCSTIKSGGCHAVALAKADQTRVPHTTSGKRSKTPSSIPLPGFHYVYILRDVATGQHHYAGVTQDLQEGFSHHNYGHVPHAAAYASRYIETAIAFRDKQKAYAYERYLKTGNASAYATRHFGYRPSIAARTTLKRATFASLRLVCKTSMTTWHNVRTETIYNKTLIRTPACLSGKQNYCEQQLHSK